MTEREDLGSGCVAGSAPKLGGKTEATKWGVGRVLVVCVLQQSKGSRGYTPKRSEESVESRKEPSGGWRGPTRAAAEAENRLQARERPREGERASGPAREKVS